LHINKVEELNEVETEKAHTFTWHLLRALSFPLRHYIFTAITWLLTWIVAVVVESASDIINSPPLTTIIWGGSVGRIASSIAFIILGTISMACLLRSADGKEIGEKSPLKAELIDYSAITDPILLWCSVALIAFFPLIFYLSYHNLQVIAVALITGNDYSKQLLPKASRLRDLIVVLLLIWAVLFYHLGLVVAGVRRGLLPIFNPLTAIAAWVSLKNWLKPTFAIVIGIEILAIGLLYLVWMHSYGLALATAIVTIVMLIGSTTIGTAIQLGRNDLNL
jgi:hypothetical protein